METLVAISAAAIQMTVVWIITAKNKDIFDKYKVAGYGRAVAELSKRNSVQGLVVKLCYGALILEFIVLAILAR